MQLSTVTQYQNTEVLLCMPTSHQVNSVVADLYTF